MSDSSEPLTNVTLPKTAATLTVRIIKSFTFRTERSLVLHGINLETTTVSELKELANQGTVCLGLRFVGKCIYEATDDQRSRRSQDGNRIEMLPWVSFCSIYTESIVSLIRILKDTLKLYTKAHGSKVSSKSGFLFYFLIDFVRPPI